jgi:myo-inositol-1(or 4)-monophosphatase
MSYKEFLDVAVKSAMEGGKIISEGFGRDSVDKKIELKGFADPVTLYDKLSEEAIVRIINSRYPAHSILTEENLSVDKGSDIKWIIDPIDGTVNFTHKIPYVAVCVAVEIEKKIVAGVIYNPVLQELYTASLGDGAFLNGNPIQVSNISNPGKSMIVTGFPYRKGGRMNELMRSMEVIVRDFEAFRRLGSAAMDLAYVACGRCDAFYEEGLKPWDMAAGYIIVREAGGVVTNYYGGDFDVYQKTIIASNGRIHERMVEILKEVSSPV